MKQTIALVSILVLLTVLLCSCGGSGSGSGLSGKYIGDTSNGGDVAEADFSGSNSITLKMDSYMDISMSGTYTISGDQLTADVSYSVGGETDNETFTFTFQQSGKTITLDGQTLTKN